MGLSVEEGVEARDRPAVRRGRSDCPALGMQAVAGWRGTGGGKRRRAVATFERRCATGISRW